MEIMVGVIGASLLFLVIVNLFSKAAIFFRRSQVRNQLQTQAQGAMNTLLHFARQGDAGSVQITASPFCGGTEAFTSLEFKTADIYKTDYLFYKDCSDPRNFKLQMIVTPRGGPASAPALLTQNVSLARFFPSSTNDLSVLNLALTLQAPGGPNQVETLALSSQVLLKQNAP